MSKQNAYEVVESERVFKGHIVNVRRDRVRMPAGNVVDREVAETTDAVAVVAVDDQKRVCLIRHYRHPQGGFVWELPAGRLDVATESPLEAAKRELSEEVQMASDSWTQLTTFISSPGFATEKIHVFLAEDAYAVDDEFEAEDEELAIVVEKRSLQQAVADVTAQSLNDGKTVVGVLLAARHLQI